MKILTIFLTFISTASSYNLCSNETVSCATSLRAELPEDACHIEVYGNPTNGLCYDRTIIPHKNKYNFGDVILKAYEDEYHRTSFNVSFKNIQWTELKTQFKSLDSTKSSSCRNFYIYENVTVSSDVSLYYDCPWTAVGHEGSAATFTYEYRKEHKIATRIYKFYIPKHEKLDKKQRSLELFLYVDMTDVNLLKLMIQVPPQKVIDEFNLTSYDVYVYSIRHNITTEEGKGKVSNDKAVNGVVEFTYSPWGHGEYYFEVVPFNENDYDEGINFEVSRTPKIVISKTKNRLVIGIVGVSILIPVFLGIMYMFRPKQDSSASKILFAYKASHNSHVNMIFNFAEKLKEWYDMDVMLDLCDIPGEETKDPSTWFQQAFYNASHLIFFISPDAVSPAVRHLYKDLDLVALRLIRNELGDTKSEKRFLVVTLPYSSQNIPRDLVNFKCYKLTNDLHKLMNNLQNKSFFSSWKKTDYYRQFEKTIVELVQKAHREITEVKNNDDCVTIEPRSYLVAQTEESVPLNSEDSYSRNTPLTNVFLSPFNIHTLDLLNSGTQEDNASNTVGTHFVDFENLDLA